jgi:lipoprotein-anchoring transpeptidase ErfK/SrfK
MKQNLILAALLMTIAAAPAAAQRDVDMMSLGDQPGYVPKTTEEQLDLVFQRQPVYFRTTEKPGTIVVHTSERFLYLVQGNNRAIR